MFPDRGRLPPRPPQKHGWTPGAGQREARPREQRTAAAAHAPPGRPRVTSPRALFQTTPRVFRCPCSRHTLTVVASPETLPERLVCRHGLTPRSVALLAPRVTVWPLGSPSEPLPQGLEARTRAFVPCLLLRCLPLTSFLVCSIHGVRKPGRYSRVRCPRSLVPARAPSPRCCGASLLGLLSLSQNGNKNEKSTGYGCAPPAGARVSPLTPSRALAVVRGCLPAAFRGR